MLMDLNKMVYSTETGRAVYRYAFKVNSDKDLRVLVVDPADHEQVPLFLGLDYQVTGLGQDDGGTIELTGTGRLKARQGLKIILKEGQALQCGDGRPVPAGPGVNRSYEEQWTGRYDETDGDCKIYVRTFDCGPLPANTIKKIPTGISNLRQVVDLRGLAVNPVSGYYPFPYTTPTAGYSVAVEFHKNNPGSPANSIVVITSESYWSSWTRSYITLEYTKDE